MPYERAGRSDKQGNRYEIRWCIYQLLRVLNEEIDAIILEAIGDDEEGVDLWIYYKNEMREGQQCKGRNAAKEKWNYGDLNAKGILEKWKTQLGRGESVSVSLVSPLSFTFLEDLVNRANNSSDNLELFYERQIKGSDKLFVQFVKDFCRSLGFDCEDLDQAVEMLNHLRRIEYHQSPDREQKDIILDKIRLLIHGDEELIYDSLVTWIIDGDILGKEIRLSQIYAFLKLKDIKLRNLSFDTRIYPRIYELNNEYKTSFKPLNNGMIVRNEADVCMKYIREGKSIIIHGMAGSGKSGLTKNVITFCEEEEIPYIALKLDKRVPRGSVKKWSEDIDLPASLVHCLNSVSKNTNAVIILDQLDALRWTSPHSSEALLVCSELTRQVHNINRDRVKKISIVFICRTYDRNNDNNINLLFDEKNQDNDWKEIEVGRLKVETVKSIVGETYDTLTGKLQNLLSFPSNLYIWQQIDKTEGQIECFSAYQLVTKWWNQLLQKAFKAGLNESELIQSKERIIEEIEKFGTLNIPKSSTGLNQSMANFLVSSGFIVEQNRGAVSFISFVHQSLYDYFLAEKMLNAFLQETDIVEIVGEKNAQTPARRYQMQMFMQNLYDYSVKDFIETGMKILESNAVRFSYKFVFFELLNQINDPTEEIKSTILEMVKDEKFRSHILANVINGNQKYIQYLREDGIMDTWMAMDKKRFVISLMQSIRGKHSREDVRFIENYIFDSKEDVSSWLRCFPFDVAEDSDEVFDLRMQVYHIYPDQIDYYLDIKSLFVNFEMRAVEIIVLMFKEKTKRNGQLHRHEELYLKSNSDFLVKNGLQVLKKLLPLLPEGSDYSLGYSEWSSRAVYEHSIERTIIGIIKKSNIALINQEPNMFWTLYDKYLGKGYTIFNTLILDAMTHLPKAYSNRVIEYLARDIEKNMFANLEEDKLLLSKKILEKYYQECDAKNRDDFMDKIIHYFPSDAVKRYKSRIEYNSKCEDERVYWSFWGDFQYEILEAITDEYLNRESMSLKRVFQRKFHNGTSRYKVSGVHSGWVSSPINGKELSDKNWMKILASKKISNRKGVGLSKEVEGGFVNSSLEQFSSSFRDVVSKEPMRMVSLVLNIDENLHDAYIDDLFTGISTSESLSVVPSYLLEKLIERYPSKKDSFRASSICRIVADHLEKQWSKEVLSIIKDIALNHINPETNKSVETNAKDKDMHTAQMLQSNSINCVRGKAAETIGALLWKGNDLFGEFKDTIEALTFDKNPAVKYASLNALWPAYYIEGEWAKKHIIRLYNDDIRNASFRDSKSMFFWLYDQYKKEVLSVIEKCYRSNDEELIKIGAYSITEMYFHKGKFKSLMDSVAGMSGKQAESILHMIGLYFSNDQFNDRAKTMIMRFADNGYDIEWALSRILIDDLLDLDRDKDFLCHVLSSKSSKKIAYLFAEYLEKSTQPISAFAELIFNLSNSVITNPNSTNEVLSAEDEISKLIIGLYDETCGLSDENNREISSKCLDVWDLMFEKQIGSARKLSFELMNR